ncbi:MAG: hypothetical protein HY961_18210 [Ignavibacteriae bacterium]|nr:hypothetical protein [Ignavibacteriota bacterium]
MFHAPYGGSKPRENPVLQYWGVFVEGKQKPIAIFQTHDVAVMFQQTMTDGKCKVRPYAFTPETE